MRDLQRPLDIVWILKGRANRRGTDQGRGRGGSVARILIVDDEPDIRFMMRLILEGAGYQVTEARHGIAGMTSAKVRRPDLVITDVMMPTMDGLEFIERLRANPKTAAIPILGVSGHSELATQATAR